MKKSLLFAAIFTMLCGAAFAQKTMVVNTEKIFKAIPAYNQAITSLEQTSKDYQKKIDDAFAAVEKMYNEYQTQKNYMSAQDRQSREDLIISREKEVSKVQQEVFGPEGELMKKRVEMLKPIQDKVFKAVNNYAATYGYDIVIDQAANATLLYFAPQNDKTEEIIKLVK